MENAIKIAGAIIDRLPKDVAPETTSGREGFVHPTGVTGSMEKAVISFIVRDFTMTASPPRKLCSRRS